MPSTYTKKDGTVVKYNYYEKKTVHKPRGRPVGSGIKKALEEPEQIPTDKPKRGRPRKPQQAKPQEQQQKQPRQNKQMQKHTQNRPIDKTIEDYIYDILDTSADIEEVKKRVEVIKSTQPKKIQSADVKRILSKTVVIPELQDEESESDSECGVCDDDDEEIETLHRNVSSFQNTNFYDKVHNTLSKFDDEAIFNMDNLNDSNIYQSDEDTD